MTCLSAVTTRAASYPRAARRNDTFDSPLDIYFREIDRTPLLSADEEKELARRVQAGDKDARDRMVRANLRLVVKIARAYAGKGIDLQDLIEEGNLGLLRAVEKFDPSRNVRFSTYATFWIKQAIRRSLMNATHVIRIPTHMVEMLRRWKQVAAELQVERGRVPTGAEVADRLGLSAAQRDMAEKALRISPVAPHGEGDGDPMLLEDMLTDGGDRADERLIGAEDTGRVHQLLGRLKPREATVLRMRFGLGDAEPTTLTKIGQYLGLTRERVRQIQERALSKLGKRLQAG